MKINNNYYEQYKDMYNCYNLIKKINPGYRLFFNKKNRRFEIVNISNNFEICKIFYCFSKNILQELRFSNIVNFNKIISKIDTFNQKTEDKKLDVLKDKTKYALSEVVKFSGRSNSISNIDLNKIIGETKC